MAHPGVEVIIGASQDEQFGPILMFGLGGILVEVLKDVSFRVIPLTGRDAKNMIREIKGFPLLEGFRGAPAVNLSYLEDMLLKVSQFVVDYPAITELDLNPVFARSNGCVAVDARIVMADAPVISEKNSEEKSQYSHWTSYSTRSRLPS
jgi:acyl-CoA synthetase (NDP forming)